MPIWESEQYVTLKRSTFFSWEHETNISAAWSLLYNHMLFVCLSSTDTSFFTTKESRQRIMLTILLLASIEYKDENKRLIWSKYV